MQKSFCFLTFVSLLICLPSAICAGSNMDRRPCEGDFYGLKDRGEVSVIWYDVLKKKFVCVAGRKSQSSRYHEFRRNPSVVYVSFGGREWKEFPNPRWPGRKRRFKEEWGKASGR